MENNKKENRQRGSVTLEAVVGFSAFLFAIFTILGFVNFCRAQMLVSAAVDTAAKELSEYAYFYEMSGLNKFEKKLDENEKIGKKNINQVISTVDQLYSNINGAVKQSVQDQANIEDMLAADESQFQAMADRAESIGNDAEAMINAFTHVGNDPLLYMRSLVSVIGSEGMEFAKRAIAVPLARAFVSRHFGSTPAEIQENMKNLGIVGGLDGMNFSLSNIFSDEEQRDIELVVYYKVELLQIFDWVVLEAPISKVAYCQGWLGGDHVITKVSTTTNADLGTEEDAQNQGDGENQQQDGTAETPTEPEQTKTNNSTGYWALQHDRYNKSERLAAFKDKFIRENLVNTAVGTLWYYDLFPETMGYTYQVYEKWTQSPEDTKNSLFHHLSYSIDTIAEGTIMKHSDGSPQEFIGVTEIIYVPENMPEEQLRVLIDAAKECEDELREYARSKGLPEDFGVNFFFSQSGGTYDYSSKESDYVNVGSGG